MVCTLYTNQIDHILVNTRFKNCLRDVITVRGTDCDSDHYLLAGKLKVKLKKPASKSNNSG